MKKYIYIISSVAFAFFTLDSCQHEIDTFNDNPNSPTELSTPTTLLTGAEIGTISNATGNLPRTLSLFTQHTNGNQFQSLDYTNYFLTETDVETDWANIYQAGVNLNQIITQFGAQNPYYDGMARVLMAINMGSATDVWGDVPFSQAFQGVSNLNPKYDTQQQVISQIQSYLDIAIADFAKPESANSYLPGKNDIFFYDFKNNVWQKDKWIKLAYGLKARYALRLSKKDASAAQKALQYAQLSLGSNSDNLVATFDGGNNQNLWYGFNNQRSGYMSMGKYFVDLLKNNSDPRLTYFAALDSHNTVGYTGSAPEDADADASPFGDYFAGGAATSNVIFSYSEIKFIEAEAQFRLGNTSAAQSALKAAISSSLINVTGSDNATFATAASSTLSLQNIITQKYVALFTTLEPYNDWRRTGYPVLTPNQASQSKKIPVRLMTPKSERTLNANATVVSSMYTPVWWAN